MKKHGFTLAEVLVTLGIIGVVSAMTIPALTQNWQKKSYVTQLHKIYNVFQQAFLEEINDKQALSLAEAGFQEWDGGDSYMIEKRFLHEHFKVVKDCGPDRSPGCFAHKYRSINGGSYDEDPNFDGYNVTIAGGPAIAFYIDGGNTDDEDYLGFITVDVNGIKGPNITGRDLFRMIFFADGVLDVWDNHPNCRKYNNSEYCWQNSATANREYQFRWCKDNSWPDSYCFGKILNDNWEMNY